MRSRKIIKKLVKITAILLLLVFAVPATAFLLLQSSRIQTELANRIMRVVSENLDTKFSISKIDMSFLYRIRLNDVYIEDFSGDTLLYVKSLTAGIRYVNPVKQEISVGSINLSEAFIGLSVDSTNNLNLKYLLDRFKRGWQREGRMDRQVQ